MIFNIIVQISGGDQDNCVMFGGYLDSVFEGFGINDDGFGSILVFEVVFCFIDFCINNCVCFVWWVVEEEGLFGLNFYVVSFIEEENKRIRLFMDYDMMVSFNYVY